MGALTNNPLHIHHQHTTIRIDHKHTTLKPSQYKIYPAHQFKPTAFPDRNRPIQREKTTRTIIPMTPDKQQHMYEPTHQIMAMEAESSLEDSVEQPDSVSRSETNNRIWSGIMRKALNVTQSVAFLNSVNYTSSLSTDVGNSLHLMIHPLNYLLEALDVTVFLEISIFFINTIDLFDKKTATLYREKFDLITKQITNPEKRDDKRKKRGVDDQNVRQQLTQAINTFRTLKYGEAMKDFYSGYLEQRDKTIEIIHRGTPDEVNKLKALYAESQGKYPSYWLALTNAFHQKAFRLAGQICFDLNTMYYAAIKPSFHDQLDAWLQKADSWDSFVIAKQTLKRLSTSTTLARLNKISMSQLHFSLVMTHPFFTAEIQEDSLGDCVGLTYMQSLSGEKDLFIKTLLQALYSPSKESSYIPIITIAMIQAIDEYTLMFHKPPSDQKTRALKTAITRLEYFGQKTNSQFFQSLMRKFQRLERTVFINSIDCEIDNIANYLTDTLDDAIKNKSDTTDIQVFVDFTSYVQVGHLVRMSAFRHSDGTYELIYENAESTQTRISADSLDKLRETPTKKLFAHSIKEDLQSRYNYYGNTLQLSHVESSWIKELGEVQIFTDSCLTLKDIATNEPHSLSEIESIRTTDFLINFFQLMQQPATKVCIEQPVPKGHVPDTNDIQVSDTLLTQMKEIETDVTRARQIGGKVSIQTTLLAKHVTDVVRQSLITLGQIANPDKPADEIPTEEEYILALKKVEEKLAERASSKQPDTPPSLESPDDVFMQALAAMIKGDIQVATKLSPSNILEMMQIHLSQQAEQEQLEQLMTGQASAGEQDVDPQAAPGGNVGAIAGGAAASAALDLAAAGGLSAYSARPGSPGVRTAFQGNSFINRQVSGQEVDQVLQELLRAPDTPQHAPDASPDQAPGQRQALKCKRDTRTQLEKVLGIQKRSAGCFPKRLPVNPASGGLGGIGGLGGGVSQFLGLLGALGPLAGGLLAGASAFAQSFKDIDDQRTPDSSRKHHQQNRQPPVNPSASVKITAPETTSTTPTISGNITETTANVTLNTTGLSSSTETTTSVFSTASPNDTAPSITTTDVNINTTGTTQYPGTQITETTDKLFTSPNQRADTTRHSAATTDYNIAPDASLTTNIPSPIFPTTATTYNNNKGTDRTETSYEAQAPTDTSTTTKAHRHRHHHGEDGHRRDHGTSHRPSSDHDFTDRPSATGSEDNFGSTTTRAEDPVTHPSITSGTRSLHSGLLLTLGRWILPGLLPRPQKPVFDEAPVAPSRQRVTLQTHIAYTGICDRTSGQCIPLHSVQSVQSSDPATCTLIGLTNKKEGCLAHILKPTPNLLLPVRHDQTTVSVPNPDNRLIRQAQHNWQQDTQQMSTNLHPRTLPLTRHEEWTTTLKLYERSHGRLPEGFQRKANAQDGSFLYASTLHASTTCDPIEQTCSVEVQAPTRLTAEKIEAITAAAVNDSRHQQHQYLQRVGQQAYDIGELCNLIIHRWYDRTLMASAPIEAARGMVTSPQTSPSSSEQTCLQFAMDCYTVFPDIQDEAFALRSDVLRQTALPASWSTDDILHLAFVTQAQRQNMDEARLTMDFIHEALASSIGPERERSQNIFQLNDNGVLQIRGNNTATSPRDVLVRCMIKAMARQCLDVDRSLSQPALLIARQLHTNQKHGIFHWFRNTLLPAGAETVPTRDTFNHRFDQFKKNAIKLNFANYGKTGSLIHKTIKIRQDISQRIKNGDIAIPEPATQSQLTSMLLEAVQSRNDAIWEQGNTLPTLADTYEFVAQLLSEYSTLEALITRQFPLILGDFAPDDPPLQREIMDNLILTAMDNVKDRCDQPYQSNEVVQELLVQEFIEQKQIIPVFMAQLSEDKEYPKISHVLKNQPHEVEYLLTMHLCQYVIERIAHDTDLTCSIIQPLMTEGLNKLNVLIKKGEI